MSDADIITRLTVIETQVKQIERESLARLNLDRARDEKLDKVLEELGRYKGFIGGVLFIVGALWAFLKTGLPFVLRAFGKDV